MSKRGMALCLSVFLACIGILAWAEEEFSNGVVSKRLIAQIDSSLQKRRISVDEKRVQILCGTPGKKGAYLNQVYDPDSGKYLAPVLPGKALHQDPFFEGIRKLHENGLTGAGAKVAIIDTGMALNHPWIKRSIKDSVDFTGEGVEDQNGHGTMVTLLLLMTAPDAGLFNVKVMDSEGLGSEENLIEGIKWSAGKGANVINLSVGVYREECKGDCKICRAAKDAAKAGALVVAAAGNEPGKTCCPAKADSGVRSVGAYNFDNKEMAPYSGIGKTVAPAGKYHFVPVK